MENDAGFGRKRLRGLTMRKHKYLSTGFALAVLFLFFPTQNWAGLPEGVKIDVLAEYPSVDVGIEKIRLIKFTFQL